MAQSQEKLSQDDRATARRRGKYRLDELSAARVAKNLVMFKPSESGIETLLAKARLSIPGLAEADDVIKVLKHTPICLLALARKSRFDPAAPVPEGFIAMLPLNKVGMELLAMDSL